MLKRRFLAHGLSIHAPCFSTGLLVRPIGRSQIENYAQAFADGADTWGEKLNLELFEVSNPNPLMPQSRSATSALLVDDERYFRRFVSQVLRKLGVDNIIEAENGDQAIDLFRLHSPEIVILDINMPRLDGVDTLAKLRTFSTLVPIIMLTSIADEMTVERCVIEGATFFIRKDVPANELTEALYELLSDEAQGQCA